MSSASRSRESTPRDHSTSTTGAETSTTTDSNERAGEALSPGAGDADRASVAPQPGQQTS